MAMNKVQFQRRLSMLEFVDLYGTQARCEDVVRRWRWPRGFICPACARTEHSEFHRSVRLYFQCSACRHQCSLTSGTIFESSKLPLPTWFVAMRRVLRGEARAAIFRALRDSSGSLRPPTLSGSRCETGFRDDRA